MKNEDEIILTICFIVGLAIPYFIFLYLENSGIMGGDWSYIRATYTLAYPFLVLLTVSFLLLFRRR